MSQRRQPFLEHPGATPVGGAASTYSRLAVGPVRPGLRADASSARPAISRRSLSATGAFIAILALFGMLVLAFIALS